MVVITIISTLLVESVELEIQSHFSEIQYLLGFHRSKLSVHSTIPINVLFKVLYSPEVEIQLELEDIQRGRKTLWLKVRFGWQKRDMERKFAVTNVHFFFCLHLPFGHMPVMMRHDSNCTSEKDKCLFIFLTQLWGRKMLKRYGCRRSNWNVNGATSRAFTERRKMLCWSKINLANWQLGRNNNKHLFVHWSHTFSCWKIHEFSFESAHAMT